eukprot:CAMPEP_0198234532 /NCGR_PEP_ID=MMETSP1446-20131203/531_1 /TAXON_ID=1461542 ORGANISM="Unidentified sp, Strain CCMP2111" /NCGR_SAMPLE_ID=MMETSP1446 /ASSEMBLY_ACC=CAM_ASM_001112 /LENGTH=292 /DNA_ID=CAMNT_0043915327 /DNA_START=286 /DNA_END=1164 /DNA_ORIENTATION=-
MGGKGGILILLAGVMLLSQTAEVLGQSQGGSQSGCDCYCTAVDADGRDATQEQLLNQEAQLSCSTCCSPDELLEKMKEYLPNIGRVTRQGKACNEPSGILSIFLNPVCWKVNKGQPCQFPFLLGYNQVVVNCTTASEASGEPWCVYDMDAWKERGEGWGYCAPESQESLEEALGSLQEPRTLDDENDPLDQIIANLSRSQLETSLGYAQEPGVVTTVQNSGGLKPAGIAAIVVVSLLIVGVLALSGFAIWKLRNRIKLRRSSKFRSMDQEVVQQPSGEVNMTSLDNSAPVDP